MATSENMAGRFGMMVVGGKIERRFEIVRGNIKMEQYTGLGESEDRQVERLTVIVQRISDLESRSNSLHDNKESFTLGVGIAIR